MLLANRESWWQFSRTVASADIRLTLCLRGSLLRNFRATITVKREIIIRIIHATDTFLYIQKSECISYCRNGKSLHELLLGYKQVRG